MKKNRFNIDMFEFSFLCEACIPPVPIARAVFWSKVIDEYYHELTSGERTNLFDWITKNGRFDMSNKDCELFYNRYNPNNQYEITTDYENDIKTIIAFKHNNRYHTDSKTSIIEEYITNIKKI